MEHFFLDLFRSHPEAWHDWGYTIVFLIAFVESILFIGIFIPGQIIIILAGFLVKLGILSFPQALLAAALGAVFGDVAGFAIGKIYSGKLPDWLSNFVKKENLEKTQRLIERHSVKTIFIGRLHSMTRTFAPFAAGTTSISFRKFFAADAFAAIIWAFLSLAIGYIFGKSFELAAASIGKFIVIATLVTVLLIIAVHFLQKHRHRISWTDFALYGSSAAFLYLFALTAHDIATGKLFHILDLRTAEVLSHIHTPFMTDIMIFLTALGNPSVFVAATAMLSFWLLGRRRYLDSLIVSLTMGTGALLDIYLKASFHKVRPTPWMLDVTGSSFPSGHAMMSLIFASLVSYILIRHIRNYVLKNALYITVFLVAVCIGLSRVYLNVHWASDVLAGIFLGAFWATFMIAIVRGVLWFIMRQKRKHELPNVL